MRQVANILQFQTRGRGLFDITQTVEAWVAGQSMSTGLLTVFCRHTSASLLIQENAAPDVRADLETFFEGVAPDSSSRYRHQDEGPDDMPAHIRAAITQTQLGIPLIDGRLALGTWQALYLFEHRKKPHARQVALHLLGA